MKKIDIFKGSGQTQELYTDLFHCTNPKCDCDTIQRDYHFCPGCGLAINWIEGSAPKETKTVVIRKSDYFKIELGHKWYRCPTCQDYLSDIDKECALCYSPIQWIEDGDQVRCIIIETLDIVNLIVIHKKDFVFRDGEKCYICPNCNSDEISHLDKECPVCEFTIKWRDDK